MPRLYIMQTGRTTWEDESRVEPTVGAPLSEEGSQEVKAVASQLPSAEIAAVYAGTSEAERQTAKLVAEKLKLKVRTHNGLHEFDYGLWQGLTFQEIKRRQPRVYKLWVEEPASVRPPGGETLQEARERLSRALKEIVKRQKSRPALLVLGPVAAGLVRCLLQGEKVEALRQQGGQSFAWCSYEVADGGESL